MAPSTWGCGTVGFAGLYVRGAEADWVAEEQARVSGEARADQAFDLEMMIGTLVPSRARILLAAFNGAVVIGQLVVRSLWHRLVAFAVAVLAAAVAGTVLALV